MKFRKPSARTAPAAGRAAGKAAGTAAAVAAAMALSLVLTGCGGAATAQPGGNGTGGAAAGAEVKTVRYQGSPNTVALVEVAEDLGYLGDVKLEWVSNTTSGPQSIQSVATDQTDIGGAFTGAVIKLIEAGAPVQAVVNYYGEDKETFTGYYVEEGSPIKTARDLIGKKIAVNTLGAHHEAIINTHLKDSGLTPEEIKQVQLVVVPPNETEVALRKKQVDVGTLGGVLQDRALAEGGVRALFTDVGVIGGPFDAGQYVLRNDFLAKNPETSRTVVTGVAKAIEWERTTPREQVIAKFEEIIAKRGPIQHWFQSGAADGFNIMPPVLPSGLDIFVDQVVPILQKRGLFRHEYTGRTLREHFGLAVPANSFERVPQPA